MVGASSAIPKGVRDNVGLISKLFRRKRASAEQPGTDLLREQGADPLLRVSRQLLTAGRSDRALVLLRAGILRFPGHAEVAELHRTAEKNEALPQLKGALATLREETSAKNHARVSQLSRRIEDDETATEHGRAAIAIEPRSPFGYRAIGRIYLDRFRADSSTVDGMNALRYFSKSCALDPRHAASLLALAEVFVLLGAPEAARRFLAPVAGSHPNDPSVEILERRCSELPSEGTSNVQELFLRHEHGEPQPSAEAETTTSSEELPSKLTGQIGEMFGKIAGTRGVWVVDANRHLVASQSEETPGPEALAGLGLVSATARSCSARMGVGNFERLLLRADDQLVICNVLGDSMTGFYFGDRPSRQSDVEQTFERLALSFEEEKKAFEEEKKAFEEEKKGAVT